jgi:D-mannonate dehydratase
MAPSLRLGRGMIFTLRRFGPDDPLRLDALRQVPGVDAPLRPDHGPMPWGERAIPADGLHDRAIGLGYLQGRVAALERTPG